MSEKKEFTLANLKTDLEPGTMARSSTLKTDYKLYKGNDPFSFASADDLVNIEDCTPSAPSHIGRGASTEEKKEFENRKESEEECEIRKQEQINAALGLCFTFSEFVTKPEIANLFGSAYYVVNDINSELADTDKRVNHEGQIRLPCGLTVSAATALTNLVSEMTKKSKSIRLLRIFESESSNNVSKVFFIYESGPDKSSARIFIPIRRNEFLKIISSLPSSAGGRRRSSRKYKKSNRRVKASKKRYTSKYSRTRRYRK